MNTYTIDFTIKGFDGDGESHRLTVTEHQMFRPELLHSGAARALVQMVAKLTRAKVEHVPLRNIHIFSCWMTDGFNKRHRVKRDVLMRPLIVEQRAAPRGRGGERIPVKKPLGRHMRPR